MKTVPIAAVPAATVPLWVLALASRHSEWRLNICTCMPSTRPPTQPISGESGSGPRVRIDRTKSGALTFGVKGRSPEEEAMAAFRALRDEARGQ
jgi:hypothetical protein